MAFKFQLGMARMSGSLVQDGGFEVRDDDDTQRFAVARDTGNTTCGGTLTAAGVTSTAAANSLGATSFNEANITNVGDVALDSISADGASFSFGSNWTAAGRTCADLGSVTTADINGGNIDGTAIGAAVVAAGSFAAVVGTTGTYSGILKTDDTTEATSTTDGSLQTDGGLSVAKSAVIGDDLDLLSDSAIMNIGSTSKFTLTAVNANNAVMATANHRLAFGDAGEYIYGDGTDLKIVSSNDIDVTGDLDVAGSVTSTLVSALASSSGTTSIGSATAAVFTAAGLLNINNATEATTATDGSLQTDGGLSVVKSAVIGDDLDLLSDAAILNFGADKDTNLTHVADTGLLLNSSRQLQFGDSGTHIAQSADGVLKLTSDAAVEVSVGAAGMKVTGVTPTLTIGDAGAEDSAVVFDGNAQDYYIGLDDTDDIFKIGLGNAVGTTGALFIDASQNVAIQNDATVADDLSLVSDAAVLELWC